MEAAMDLFFEAEIELDDDARTISFTMAIPRNEYDEPTLLRTGWAIVKGMRMRRLLLVIHCDP
jgi:hypothetical protein